VRCQEGLSVPLGMQKIWLPAEEALLALQIAPRRLRDIVFGVGSVGLHIPDPRASSRPIPASREDPARRFLLVGMAGPFLDSGMRHCHAAGLPVQTDVSPFRVSLSRAVGQP
jgi:hypothetical protein